MTKGPDHSGPFVAVVSSTQLDISPRLLTAGIGTLLSQVAKVSQGPSLHLSGYHMMKLTKILWNVSIGQSHRIAKKIQWLCSPGPGLQDFQSECS